MIKFIVIIISNNILCKFFYVNFLYLKDMMMNKIYCVAGNQLSFISSCKVLRDENVIAVSFFLIFIFFIPECVSNKLY